jgi:predicted TIM-barrel fold metal-dependent hydrolase
MAIEIFAHHCHVFPAEVNPNGTIDRLLKLMDECGIGGGVCFAPFLYQIKRAGLDFNPNDWLARELKQYPNLRGFGTVDIKSPDVKDQVKHVVDLGFKGIKLHPNAQEFDIVSREAFAVYEAAQKHNVFVTFHSGVHHYRIKEYNVLSFDEVAHHFPDLRFSMEHVGGYHFFPQALAVIVNNIPFPPVPGRRCMVFAGLTSVFTQDYNRFWYLSKDRLIELVAQAGVEQCIFGLDFPYNLEPGTKKGLQTLQEIGLTEEQQALILGGNLRRELGMLG